MNWQNKIAEQVSSIPRSGIREFFDLVTGRTDIISLGVGEPDFVTPWNIREAAIYSLEKGHTSYTSNYGLESLRRSIVKYVDGFFYVNYDPLREVLVTVGVSEAIDLALRAILNPGDEVLYHEENEPFEASIFLEENLDADAWEDLYQKYLDEDGTEL